MIDPRSPLELIYIVAKTIYDQVQLVKANQKQCYLLVERIRIIEAAVHGLDKISDRRQYEPGLNELLGILRECLEFMKKFSESSKWQRWILKAGNYKETFEGLNTQLQQSMQRLNLGLAAQQIANHEMDKQDKAAQAADMAFIQGHQAEIAKANLEALKAMQVMHLKQQEEHHILQLQMAAIQSQLKKVTVAKPTASTTTVIDEKHRIPYYDLIFKELIAEGSFGKVYRGEWEGQTVAIKTLEGTLTAAEEAQFIREVAIMSRLRHPNITAFYGACLEEKQACLVMEYMGGGSLTKVLREKALTLEQQKSLSLDIGKGLAYLHHQGVAHRDLKSANILVDDKGIAKLADFGLSKIDAVSVRTTTERSQALPWQAPECFERQATYTTASDIYSFGVILWEIVTRRLPSLTQSQLKDCATTAIRETIPSDTPHALSALIQHCWKLEPSHRPDAAQVIQQLEAYQVRPPSPCPESYYEQGANSESQKDFLKAFELYRKAANKGYIKAKTNMGHLRLTVVPQNKPEALQYFLEAAESGHVRAMFNAAQMLEYGDGVPQDIRGALRWYQAVCEKEPSHTIALQKCDKLKAKLGGMNVAQKK